MSLVTRGFAKLTATLTKSLDQADASFPANLGLPMNFTNGTAANQADLMFADTRTTSTNDNLDLAGVLADAFGDTITMARVKAVMVKASSSNTVNVHVGGNASTSAVSTLFGDVSDIAVVRPGGGMVLFAPDATAYAVTAGTADTITVAPSDGATSITYDIMVIGSSA